MKFRFLLLTVLATALTGLTHAGEPSAVVIDVGRAVSDEDNRPLLFGLQRQSFQLPLAVTPPLTQDARLDFDVLALDELFAASTTVPAGSGNPTLTVPAIPVPPGGNPLVIAELTLTDAAASISTGTPDAAVYALVDLDGLASPAPAAKIAIPDCEASLQACLACVICAVASTLPSPYDQLWCLGLETSKGAGRPLDLTLLRRLRDELMVTSASGRYYADRYRRASSALARATFASPTLVYDLLEANRLWAPAIQSVLNGDGSYVVDSAMINIYEEVIAKLAAEDVPGLSSLIALENARIDPSSLQGATAATFWDHIESADTDSLFQADFE